MTNEDKRLIVESVGLCWHEWEMSYNNQIPRLRLYRCLNEKCKYHNTDNGVLVQPQLDPLDPADMYGKIIPALKKMNNEENDYVWARFRGWIIDEHGDDYDYYFIILTDPRFLAVLLRDFFKGSKAPKDLVEYFKEKL